MRPSWIAFPILLLVVLLPSGAQAQATGRVETAIGWLSLSVSDLNALLHTYNYPGVSEHFLSISLQTIFGAQDLPLRVGMRGQLALALPESSSQEQTPETNLVFLYGGIVAEFTQSVANIGQISVGSLFGIGGAFLNLSRFRQDFSTFDRALTDLVEALGYFKVSLYSRGFGIELDGTECHE